MLTATWASNPGPGRPFSIGSGSRPAIATCAEQHLQAYLSRACSSTISDPGTYSSCSRVSSPIGDRSPPQPGQARPSRGDVVDDSLAGQGRRQGLATVARRLRLGRRRAGRWGQGGHGLDRDLGHEEEQLSGIDRLALLAIPLAEEQFELVLEAGDEVVLLTQRLGQLADLAVGGVEVAGECHVFDSHT